MNKDLNTILTGWPAESGPVVARTFVAADGNTFIQLRVELGLLQMAIDGRPDSERPEGFETMLDCVRDSLSRQLPDTPPSQEQQASLAREMLQFYRRRISLMALAKQAQHDGDSDRAETFYGCAIRDADHNLAILDLLRSHDAELDISEHEQYRPFIIMHRAACRAELALLEQDPDEAIEHLKKGMATIQDCAAETVDIGDGDDHVLDIAPFTRELRRFERHIRRKYRRRRTLREQLADAVASENFEHAARLRDALAARSKAKEPAGE